MANEDWYHLWEILYALRSLPNPPDEADLRKKAEATLVDLLRQGYIYVAAVRFSDNGETRLSETEALRLLSADESWIPKDDDVALSFASTAAGKAAWC